MSLLGSCTCTPDLQVVELFAKTMETLIGGETFIAKKKKKTLLLGTSIGVLQPGHPSACSFSASELLIQYDQLASASAASSPQPYGQ